MCCSTNSFRLLCLVFILSAPLTAVTVNPALCPTNKIAPHRRIGSRNSEYQPRTLGAFYELLAPGGNVNQGYDPNLQEEPQKDESDDCGEIEDYDENDLSAMTPHYNRRDSIRNARLFFGLFDSDNSQRPPDAARPPGNQPYPQGPQYTQGPQYPQGPQYSQGPQYPQVPQYPQSPQYPQGANYPQNPQRPQRPPQPSRPQGNRPPYGFGGYFGSNHYRPPVQHYPSDDIKPVHDGNSEPQTTYRPHVVGGPIGHVVGVSPVTVRTQRPLRGEEYTTEAHYYQNYPSRPQYTARPLRGEKHATETPHHQNYHTTPQHTSKRPGPRKLNNNNDSILGSFLDLLFK